MTLSNMLTCSPAQQAPNSPSKLSAPPTRSGASPGLARSRIRGQLPPPAQPRRALLAQPRGAAGIWGFSPDAPPIWDSVPDAPAGPDTAAIWQSLPDAPPDGWIAWRVHTHHQFPEGAPGQRIVARPGTVWHLPGPAAACQTANGPPAAGVRKCGAGRTRPSGPSHLATGPERGSAATQGVGAEGAARFTADEAGRWGRAPIVRRRPPRWDSCRRRRRLPQALALRNLTWCAPREHFGR